MVERREGVPGGTDKRAGGGDIAHGVLPKTDKPSCQRVSRELFRLNTLLTETRAILAAATATFTSIAPGVQDFTRTTETKRRHALEKHDRDLATVQALELRLGIHTRWVLGGQECEEAGRLLSMRRYQRSLDNLEGLVVARIFELTKMNRSQTGE